MLVHPIYHGDFKLRSMKQLQWKVSCHFCTLSSPYEKLLPTIGDMLFSPNLLYLQHVKMRINSILKPGIFLAYIIGFTALLKNNKMDRKLWTFLAGELGSFGSVNMM